MSDVTARILPTSLKRIKHSERDFGRDNTNYYHSDYELMNPLEMV